MSDTIQFSGIMVKHSPVIKKNDVFANLQIKTSEVGAIRTFMQPFQKAGVEGIVDLFKEEYLPWNKINMPLSEYNLYYKVVFEGVEFDAKLVNIAVSNKRVKDSSVTEYILSFDKCIESNDANVSYYIKRKEEDENGKMQLIQYPVTLESIEGMPGTNI